MKDSVQSEYRTAGCAIIRGSIAVAMVQGGSCRMHNEICCENGQAQSVTSPGKYLASIMSCCHEKTVNLPARLDQLRRTFYSTVTLLARFLG